MVSKHMMPVRRTPRLTVVLVSVCAAIAFTAVAAAVAVRALGGEVATARQSTGSAPAAVQQSVSQVGRLVAVTPTSVTAQSVDGFARTYLVNAETNVITLHGSLMGGAATSFEVNDEVAIVGVVRDGQAVATAVADKQVSNLNGPPMDAV